MRRISSKRKNGRRHARAARDRRLQHRQLLRPGVPGHRLAVAQRRQQLERRADAPRRPLHRHPGAGRPALLHPVLLLHPEGVAGRRHRRRRHLHGGSEGGQADVEDKK